MLECMSASSILVYSYVIMWQWHQTSVTKGATTLPSGVWW